MNANFVKRMTRFWQIDPKVACCMQDRIDETNLTRYCNLFFFYTVVAIWMIVKNLINTPANVSAICFFVGTFFLFAFMAYMMGRYIIRKPAKRVIKKILRWDAVIYLVTQSAFVFDGITGYLHIGGMHYFHIMLICFATFPIYALASRIQVILLPSILYMFLSYIMGYGWNITLPIIALIACAISTTFYHMEYLNDLEKLEDCSKMERYRILSSIDELTKVLNRRGFENIVSEMADRSNCCDGYLYYIDIDFFKKYNDTFGHGAGDDILRKVAAAIKNVTNCYGGVVCRVGGEEFIVYIPFMEDDFREIGDTICDSVRDLKLETADKSVSDWVTVSIGGVKVINGNHKDFLVGIEKADQKLYQAKQLRNRFCY